MPTTEFPPGTRITALGVREDGVTMCALWPPFGCGQCHRAAAIGAIVLIQASEARGGARNEYRCLDCLEPLHAGARWSR
jgi:hypothetical protein